MSSQNENDSTSLTIHALLLKATAHNWGEYVQDLSTQIQILVSQVRFRLRQRSLTQKLERKGDISKTN